MLKSLFIETEKNINEQIKDSQDALVILLRTSDAVDIEKFVEKMVEYIKISGLYLNLALMYKQTQTVTKEVNLVNARKNLNSALSLVGNQVGKVFISFASSSQKSFFLEKLDLLKIVEIFKVIGFHIDRLDHLVDYTSKLKLSITELREKFCYIYINSIDFKHLIRKMDYENQDYEEYVEVMDLTKKIIEEAAEGYWNLHMKDPRLKDSLVEIKRGMILLEILNKLNITTNDVNNKERVTKKLHGWENYKNSLMKKKS